MRIDIITLFPQMFEALTDFGVVGRAIQREILTLRYWNPRDFADNKHNRVDDRPYGGGPGMLMQYVPMQKTLAAAKQENSNAQVIYLSPQGRKLDQAGLQELANNDNDLILINGRYEGIDERIIETSVDQEWSIGDFVISGGELASMVMIDGISRLLPDVLGHEASAEQDSFSNGLLDCPHYTRPEVIEGLSVPNVLMSGDHKAIENWRLKQSLGRTAERRPDLLKKLNLTNEEQLLLDEYIQESKKV